MFQALKLLLPALIPSWRFFDTIAPSPRIEFAVLKTLGGAANWREFRPRPAHLPLHHMFGRLVWNPRWNESLFLVSCAERLMEQTSDDPDDHSHQEILSRLQAELARSHVDARATPYVKFRLVFIHRQGAELEKVVTFESPVHPVEAEAGS
jgi:hypothetical protein